MTLTTIPLLSILIFLPLVGAFFILLARTSDGTFSNIKNIALLTSGITLVLGCLLFIKADFDLDAFQYVEKMPWIPGLGIHYAVGLDGVSFAFVLLACVLTFLALVVSLPSITQRVKEYCLAFLVLQTFMMGTFAAMDLVLFYLFFEGVLIPMFFIIALWGGADRIQALWKFFLLTLLGSVIMLVGIVYLYLEYGSSDIYALYTMAIPPTTQRWIWVAFFASFAVKMPMVPLHTWLPSAHVEAPTAGSILLAGVLLKMGGYGFFRLSIPILPDASHYFSPMMLTLSGVAVIYASALAFVQTDIKKLIAYSSIAHMGIVTAGLFTFTELGFQGALVQMISHGLISGALFMGVGILYVRTHTRQISDYSGVAKVLPLFSAIMLIVTLGNMGMPGTSGFVGEILVILGAYPINAWLAAVLGCGMILGAIYGLTLYKKVFLGIPSEAMQKLAPLTAGEKFSLSTLMLLSLWIGLYPQPLIDLFDNAVIPVTEKTANLTQGFMLSEEPTESDATNDSITPDRASDQPAQQGGF